MKIAIGRLIRHVNMRVRPPGEQSRFHITHSELFEAGYYALQRQFPFLDEAYDNLEWTLSRTPLAESVPVRVFENRNLRLTYTPKMSRYPGLRVLFEVSEVRRLVHMWHLDIR